MKKTVSVNIKGMNFLIEEDAYELLQDYMQRLSHALRNEKGNREIIEDVELRVAELCSSKLTERKQVIEKEDIEQILDTLGDPSQFVDEEQEGDESFSKSTAKESTSKTNEKRLFRDTDNATIAGICAGIANFFNIDVVIIRAIFIVMFLFGGFGFPLYVILWIIVPKANNTIDKLRMRGKPITVETVREEVETAAERISKETRSFADRIRKDELNHPRFTSIGNAIRIAIGSGMIAFGLFLLVIFLIFGVGGLQIIPVQSDSGFLSFSQFGELVLEDTSSVQMAWIGMLLAGFSGILFILLAGVKLIFKIRNRWSKLTLGALFISGFVGIVMCIYVGALTGREMTIEGEIEREIGTVNTEQLMIVTEQNSYGKFQDFNVKSEGRMGLLGIHNNKLIESGIHVEYRTSSDSLYHVYQNLSAHSHSHRKALAKAKNIEHNISLSQKELHVSTSYAFPADDKLRDQEVYVIIEVPAGKSVSIDGNTIYPGNASMNSKDDNELYNERGYIEYDGEYKHRH